MSAEEEAMIESLKLAMQAQEEIRQQLLDEIKTLESEQPSQKGSLKAYNFYKSSLRHAMQEKKAVEQQIDNFNTNILPELHQQMDRLQQKKSALEQRILDLQVTRDEGLLVRIENEDQRYSAIQQFTASLKKEIVDLCAKEEQLKAETAVQRKELHALQESSLSKQRETAKQNWKEEMADELGLMKKHLARRRSNTIASQLPSKQPNKINRRMSLRQPKRVI